MNQFEKMLKSFEEIPRDSEKAGKNREEIQAVRDLKELLEFLEKQMKGIVTEQDRKNLLQKKEKIEEGIQVLREYLSKNAIFDEE